MSVGIKVKVDSDIDAPGARQARAADPQRSVWVGASAGTGKTKVLIDRLLRLMLPRAGQPAASASAPEKILCLTFTKTAAAEMSNRIYKELSGWAVMDDKTLEAKLADLTGEAATPVMMQEACRLFARVLDTPGGLKIMTLHSFCQSVLKRFPVEAGLPPHFELMDEQGAVEYLTRALHGIISAAREKPDSVLAKSFSSLVLHLDPETMADLMAKIMSGRSQLVEMLRHHKDSGGEAKHTIGAVYKKLGLTAADNEASILKLAGSISSEAEADLRRAVRTLLDSGSKEDKDKAELMEVWLARPESRAELMENYQAAFLTDKGELRKRQATAAAVKVFPEILTVMQREAERVQGMQDKLKSFRLAELNAALLTVSAEMVGRYESHKQETDKLDFDDLIIRTRQLLSQEGMVNWVLYKLDEGIDHILLDEAQDTSPAQWQVVRALAEDFFAGQGRSADKLRTLFVVGDEKQSIFSFQGADPSEFARMQEFFGLRARAVQEGWEVFLDHSFRSTYTVLDLVDRVFADENVRRGVVADITRGMHHLPFRKGHAGLVELWPLIKPEEKVEAEHWKMPLAVETGETPAAQLAQKIAVTVKGWIDSQEILPSRGRPIRAGDVLILVQSRGVLVETLMRALKEEGVPVAGIDRLKLTEEISVMDLLALAAFVLQPRDDLALASLLKSPLIGLGEEDLYRLCYNRRATLWARVQDEYPDTAEWLSRFIGRSGYATPYEFFAEALNAPCPADPVSGRRAFFGRLGFDIQDALDEFLNACLHYEQSHTPSLQTFADWFMRGETEVKREQETQGIDQVRIMTVHASKGLQAPIVFLPDTTKKLHDHNKGRVRLLWPAESDKDGVMLWSPRGEFDARVYTALRMTAAEKQEEEYRRLLYVALTRAEDRLYIAGSHGQKKPVENCWYNLVDAVFPKAEEAGAETVLRRVSHPQEVPAVPEKGHKQKSDAFRQPLPGWVFEKMPLEPTPPAPLAPSRPDDEEPAAIGPLAAEDNAKFRRGNIMHHILEILPQLPEASRASAVAAYLARPALNLPPSVQKEFAAEVMSVLSHPEFAPVFGPASRAEVPVVGLVGAGQKVLSGQIDRLLVTPDEVLVVDYKTNRPPPSRAEDVPVIYLKQMAAYIAVLQQIYPGKPVRAALLWTDKLHLMPLPEGLLAPYKL